MGVRRSLSHWGAMRAEVSDGRLVAVEPFEHDPHPTDMISVWPEMVYSPVRVAEPVVRRGWLEKDGGAARGEDEYVAVGWEKALDLAAAEIDRVRTVHGNASILGGSYGWSSAGRLHHARTLVRRFLGAAGGFTDQVTNYSYGAAMAFLPRVLGVHTAVGDAVTSFDTIAESCDVMLAFGGLPSKNGVVTSGGFGEHTQRRFRDALAGRVRVVSITPYRADTEPEFQAEWLPIRPNADAALVMALTHEVYRAGREDRAFLSRYCEGHERYRAYLMGESDGQPKSADWAAPLTGIPAERIRALAADLPGRRVMLSATWSLQRARHGEQIYWAVVALAAVLGQIGLPGGGFAFGYGSANAMGVPRYGTPTFAMTAGNPAGSAIPCARVADLLLDPGGSFRFNGRDITYPDIRLIYWAGGNPFHHHQDLNRLRAAFRRPDCVIVNECYWTATARHADIVLPATTPMERADIGGSSRDPYVLAMHKLIEPVGDARDDFEIFAGLARRLGFEAEFTGGRDAEGWMAEAWKSIAGKLAARGSAVPAFEEFWEKGYHRLATPNERYVMFEDFRRDPEGHRLGTPSGRVELFSAAIAAEGLPGQPGHPVWLDPEEWLGAPAAKRFPLHLLTPQPARRLHGQMDTSSYSRAGKRQDREIVTLHPDDAAARGIRDGDAVRLFNDRGACLAIAGLDAGLMPGVALLPTGATWDPDGTQDRNSNPNTLTRDIGTSELGQGCAAQSCLIEIERFAGPLPPLRIHEPPVIRPAS